ncbi:MAG: hypothetical protein V4587_08660 [Acidobacteriota bacterium]
MKTQLPWFRFGQLSLALLSCFSLFAIVVGCSDAIPGAPPPAPVVNISASPGQLTKGSTATSPPRMPVP